MILCHNLENSMRKEKRHNIIKKNNGHKIPMKFENKHLVFNNNFNVQMNYLV